MRFKTREEQIKEMRDKGMTLKEISWEFRVSRQRIFQILKEIELKELREIHGQTAKEV